MRTAIWMFEHYLERVWNMETCTIFANSRRISQCRWSARSVSILQDDSSNLQTHCTPSWISRTVHTNDRGNAHRDMCFATSCLHWQYNSSQDALRSQLTKVVWSFRERLCDTCLQDTDSMHLGSRNIHTYRCDWICLVVINWRHHQWFQAWGGNGETHWSPHVVTRIWIHVCFRFVMRCSIFILLQLFVETLCSLHYQQLFIFAYDRGPDAYTQVTAWYLKICMWMRNNTTVHWCTPMWQSFQRCRNFIMMHMVSTRDCCRGSAIASSTSIKTNNLREPKQPY